MSDSTPLFGWRGWGYPFEEDITEDGHIRMGGQLHVAGNRSAELRNEVFPFDGHAVARCNVTPEQKAWDLRSGKPMRVCDEPHISPDPRCKCGIYGRHDLSERRLWERMPYRVYWAIYWVIGGGRYAYGFNHQWRAQYVKPVAISYRKSKAARHYWETLSWLAENYDIPIFEHGEIPSFMEMYGLSLDPPSSLREEAS